MNAPYPVRSFDPAVRPLHVVIIGGGVGGLALAQGLRRGGVSAAVYERDRSLTSRLQGYRVHVSPGGSLALHECLPPHLFDAFDRTCGKPARAIHFMTERMKPLLTIDASMVKDDGGIARHRSVSRITLRQVLMAELEVHCGRTFVRYEERGGRVVAHFDDGTTAEGDILVAADGGGSRVRRQLLPDAPLIDTGVVAIGGKVFLDVNRDRVAPPLRDGMCLVGARDGISLFVALQEVSETAGEIGGNEPGGEQAGAVFENTRSYVMWGLGATRERLGLDGGSEHDPARLATIASRAVAGWAPAFRELIALADPSTLSQFAIRTATPVGPWPTGRVTLIGDAIHAMTPYRGIGANMALEDAVRLERALVAAARGERDLLDAVGDYEREMRDYGFRAVRNSLRAMRQTVDAGAVRLTLQRLMFRAIDRIPPLKRWMASGMGRD
jgi:2-polyprenyl-6-methoxyphenol hydroxylase-like FAD-dependent oxidoreductase